MSQNVPPSNSDTPELTATQRHAAMLLAYLPKVKVARICATTARTINRWRRNPAFVAEYAKACQNVGGQAMADAEKLTRKAVATFSRNMDCGDPKYENEAARIIMEIVKGHYDVKTQSDLLESLKRAEALIHAAPQATP